MFILKTVTVITLAITACAMPSHASAQTSPQTLETAQPILSQTSLVVKSAEAKQAVPTEISSETTTRKAKRVVKHLPAQTSATQTQGKDVYGHTINANASEENAQTRFIYSQRKEDTSMPVYISEDANRSR